MLGGREELRATILRPYWLRLRDERGEGAARAMLSTVGLATSALDDETAWISVGAARRAMASLGTALGEEAIAHCSPWMVHPETLGSYVQLLRVSSEPLDAYRHLTAHAAETTRVGTYHLTERGRCQIEVEYTPLPSLEEDHGDRLLCLARAAELEAIPVFWGLAPAIVTHSKCLAQGDPCCRYSVRWAEYRPTWLWTGVGIGALVGCGLGLLSGRLWTAVVGMLIGLSAGGTIGALLNRIGHERQSRALERHRILALERGLELRGESALPDGEPIGSVLGGKYRIIRRIGSGGIGAVYAAEHIGLGHRVAIKLLRGPAATDAAEVARLRREAQVQVSIEHPNVVRTLDLDQTSDGSIYVVMELLRGVSLAERLRDGPLSAGHTVAISMAVCRALSIAHRLGVVHRDLKPGNVFLCDDGTYKVLDFGMSKFAQAESLTQEGYTLGTPEYMSPEQCIGAPLDSRSDLYALGVLMYEMVTGEIPIQSRNRRDLLELHQREVPVPMRERRPDLSISPRLDQIVLSCLAKRASQRPSSAENLETLLSEIPPEEFGQSAPPLPSDEANHGTIPATTSELPLPGMPDRKP
jgi:eukaryotic-like serine/threonine-protein kinase